MKRDPLKQPVTRQRLWYLFDGDVLPVRAWGRAQQLAGYVPTPRAWLGFIDRLLLIVGALSLVAGVFFFFAFNWADMPRLARFATVQGTVVIATALAFVLRLESWGGRVSLLSAALLVGATLGVVGQAYQTGADSWRLFQIWTLLITGWVLISRWNALYAVWMILANTTLILYWQQVIVQDYDTLNLLLISLNFVFVLLWDGLEQVVKIDFMRERWHLHLFAAAVIAYTTSFVLDWIFNSGYGTTFQLGNLPVPLYLSVIGLLLAFYTLFQRDLAMVALSLLSVLVVVVSGVGRVLWDWLVLAPYGYSFLMGIITVGLTAGLTFVLRRLQQRWEAAA